MGEIVSLNDLAVQINVEHSLWISDAQGIVARTIEVGRLLTEAKLRLKAEEGPSARWGPWVEQNCPFGEREAQRYMRAYAEREKIRHSVSDFQSIRSVFAALDAPELPGPPEWEKSEKQRRKAVESGRSVVANIRDDKNLIEWAQAEGLFVRIDRTTDWGNPFILEDDGTREDVLEAYQIYLSYKPSLQRRYPDLVGKVLGCWCYPEECHGNVLIREAYGETADDEAQRVGRPRMDQEEPVQGGPALGESRPRRQTGLACRREYEQP